MLIDASLSHQIPSPLVDLIFRLNVPAGMFERLIRFSVVYSQWLSTPSSIYAYCIGSFLLRSMAANEMLRLFSLGESSMCGGVSKRIFGLKLLILTVCSLIGNMPCVVPKSIVLLSETFRGFTSEKEKSPLKRLSE